MAEGVRAEGVRAEVREVQAEYEPVPHVMTGRQPGNAYDEEVHLLALNEALSKGKSVAVLTKQLGISKRTLQRWIQEVEQERDLDARVSDTAMIRALEIKRKELLDALTTDKLSKASARDIAIAFGILTDKHRDMLGPQTRDDAINLRIAWKDGTGAVELSTGRKGGGKRT